MLAEASAAQILRQSANAASTGSQNKSSMANQLKSMSRNMMFSCVMMAGAAIGFGNFALPWGLFTVGGRFVFTGLAFACSGGVSLFQLKASVANDAHARVESAAHSFSRAASTATASRDCAV